jgi:ribose transport system permease protein
MQKKDNGLLILILVVGTITAIINPLFISPINLANTATWSACSASSQSARAFVIVTGGIELRSARSSRCSRAFSSTSW